ncbi:MAG: chemotaxis protein CheB [Ectothiorhodospiraceae bacterium]|nr:chemotaxis protein CheB [Ectothiorhodospiraceae bacterium]
MDTGGNSPSSDAVGTVTVAILSPGGQGEALAAALEGCGLATCRLGLEDVRSGRTPDRGQALLVDLHRAPDGMLDVLDELIDQAGVPVLFNEAGLAEQPRAWVRRLARKLRSIAVPRTIRPAATVTPQVPPTGPMVWVLGASFGGPEAVKRFLDAMPEVPPVCFLLAQHIGEGFVDLLASQLTRSTRFRVRPAADGQRPEPGIIHVAPVESRIRFEPSETFRLEPDTVRRPHRPSIDCLLEEVAAFYGPRAGVIVFSGMGDDGVRGARAVADAGGQVWAQDSDSCTISSMPDCAAATGVVSRRGPPEALAKALVEYLQARETTRAAQ